MSVGRLSPIAGSRSPVWTDALAINRDVAERQGNGMKAWRQRRRNAHVAQKRPAGDRAARLADRID